MVVQSRRTMAGCWVLPSVAMIASYLVVQMAQKMEVLVAFAMADYLAVP